MEGASAWLTKPHLDFSVDSETQEIQAVVLSEASLDDAGAVPELLDQSTGSVEQVGGDARQKEGIRGLRCQRYQAGSNSTSKVPVAAWELGPAPSRT